MSTLPVIDSRSPRASGADLGRTSHDAELFEDVEHIPIHPEVDDPRSSTSKIAVHVDDQTRPVAGAPWKDPACVPPPLKWTATKRPFGDDPLHVDTEVGEPGPEGIDALAQRLAVHELRGRFRSSPVHDFFAGTAR